MSPDFRKGIPDDALNIFGPAQPAEVFRSFYPDMPYSQRFVHNRTVNDPALIQDPQREQAECAAGRGIITDLFILDPAPDRDRQSRL